MSCSKVLSCVFSVLLVSYSQYVETVLRSTIKSDFQVFFFLSFFLIKKKPIISLTYAVTVFFRDTRALLQQRSLRNPMQRIF